MTARIRSALLWIAAFAFACGIFFCLTLLLRALPPVDPVAIGVVTIENVSKARDYAAAALFLLLVPPLTIALRRAGARATARLGTRDVVLFALPYIAAPFFFLTTGKVGWVLLLPLALSFAAPHAARFLEGQARNRELRPYHTLVFAEGMAWIMFRDLVTGKRIGHIPTLFLETVFVALFLALFWIVALYIARMAQLTLGAGFDATYKRVAYAGLPLIALPIVAVLWVPTPNAGFMVIGALVIGALIRPNPDTPRPRNLAAYAIIPLLIYLLSYASTAHLQQWIDLFHRGEAIGPASDYLRGKVPYRGVFALHGMLEDGLLDAWLMQLFGRGLDIAVMRSVVIGSFLAVSLWYLGMVLFESIPLALLVVAMGAWTTAENNRTFFQVAAVAFFWHALKRGNRFSMIMAGAFSGMALFFSYEIGVYSIAGGVLCLLLLRARELPRYLLGIALGAAPFLIYLATRGALGDFFVTSFITIPRIIDAVWSLPFPDLVAPFRNALSLHTLSDFVLYEKFHLILSPLVIAIAAVYCLQRWIRGRLDTLDRALIVLVVFAAITQRTAFGRAEFRHQYFAAFLLGPMLVLLAVLLARKLREMWSGGDDGVRAFVAMLVTLGAMATAVLFWIPDLVDARINDFVRYQARAQRLFHEPNADAVEDRINAVTSEVRALVPKWRDPIFDFSNQPAFYFFCDRPNPTRFYQVPILSPRVFQSETILALERAKPKVVIRRSPEGYDTFDGVPNPVRAQAVAAYLDDCYEFNKSIRGVELWRRRANAAPAPLARYLRLIHVPGTNELVNPGYARVVFPAIGSGEGMGGAYWQSDLTMHNPLRERITVSMRYVAGDKRVDRGIDLAPSQTMRWDDVAKTFFNAPGSIGTLWIQYVNTRAPVMVVRTWDSAHGGHATMETPLTMNDSATAGSPTPELAIIGLPSLATGGRHINVGVVNVGIVPAQFRITARRARGGDAVGKPVESGVPEDEVWVVRDVEAALGMRIDEGTTLRITALQGTGVAFASIVGENGDSQIIAAVPAQR